MYIKNLSDSYIKLCIDDHSVVIGLDGVSKVHSVKDLTSGGVLVVECITKTGNKLVRWFNIKKMLLESDLGHIVNDHLVNHYECVVVC